MKPPKPQAIAPGGALQEDLPKATIYLLLFMGQGDTNSRSGTS